MRTSISFKILTILITQIKPARVGNSCNSRFVCYDHVNPTLTGRNKFRLDHVADEEDHHASVDFVFNRPIVSFRSGDVE